METDDVGKLSKGGFLLLIASLANCALPGEPTDSRSWASSTEDDEPEGNAKCPELSAIGSPAEDGPDAGVGAADVLCKDSSQGRAVLGQDPAGGNTAKNALQFIYQSATWGTDSAPTAPPPIDSV